MSKYYRITSYTPYCGEERYDYIVTDSERELHYFAQDCCESNAYEWYDEEYVEDEEEYFGECGYKVEEIDYQTWKEEVQ
jgi:hypothetical protein